MGATGNGGVVSLHVSPGQVAAFSGNANEFLAGIGMQCFREDETDREKFENEEIQALRNGTKGGRVSMEDTGQASSPPPPLRKPYRDRHGRGGSIKFIFFVDEGVGVVLFPFCGLGAAAGLHTVWYAEGAQAREDADMK